MRTAASFLVAGFVACIATAAFAQGVLRYSWGADANVVVADQDWAGPTTYAQNLSVTGLSGTIDRIDVTVDRPSLPSAWRFLFYFTSWSGGSEPGLDCTGHPAVAVANTIANAVTIPGGQLGAYGFSNVTSPGGYLNLTVDISPPLVAQPGTRYAIAALTFDLANAGDGDGSCPGVGTPFCFRVLRASTHAYGAPYGVSLPIALGGEDVLRWRGGTGDAFCLSTTPARTRTWGELKTRYR